MKESELRIWNLLQDQNGNLLKVVQLEHTKSKQGFGCEVVDRSKYPLPDGWKAEPIPLTEKWLLKFGFHHSEVSDSPIFIDSFSLEIPATWGERLLIEAKKIDGVMIAYLIMKGRNHLRNTRTYKHVHSLQNLYFALTGEELTINEG